jgi:antitoxin (DNA-binding transcriptional repressor) of toxin-antitoxin stability system
MTIHVNIGEAKTRFSELCAAALRGEEVVVQKAGVPKLKLVPIDAHPQMTAAEIARMRVANIGKYKAAFQGFDLSLEAFKAQKTEYGDAGEKLRRICGPNL